MFSPPTVPTPSERVMVVHNILTSTPYSDENAGISNLKTENIIIDFYPVHDGPHEWDDTNSTIPSYRQVKITFL